ncbi:DUF1304 domain-containing protein [Polaribacter aestuariivivens]|uniref:DUF1304 domain-containing protein n=1 Tax=Polaribacter aestuariivivens TaxID=2304626 RepID=UPI003F4924E2
MENIKLVAILFVSIIHLYILFLEMYLWTSEKGIKSFGLKNKEFAQETKVMAANQGLYNGFLAIGLLWFLLIDNTNGIKYLLVCVIVAGLYGAYSTRIIKIIYIQSIPAIIALLLTLFF